mgnify:CR=1 FL=1
MERSFKARVSGVVNRCRRAVATALMSVVAMTAATSVHAAAFTEDFTSPFAQGTSVQRTLGGQSFTFTMTSAQPDGDLAWDVGEMVLFSGAVPDPGIETLKIARTDGQDFRFAGLRLKVSDESAQATVQPYRDGSPVGSPVTLMPSVTQQLGFGNLLVDEVRITSTDFWFTAIDNFAGDTVAFAPPTVTDAKISISGASGNGGAYKIGDTVTATWNNTAGGDNNSDAISGVTVDFSQFGGGSAVPASNSSNTWTATYTITSGAIDTTSRNVSVTATSAGGSTTTADTTNATVDSVAPTVTDARISISGASGTGGAFKIGDTVTATWNNTAGGDNNSDSISSVTVNFTQFGGGAAVSASNSSGTWTATYTVVAGAIDNTNRNVTVTVTDNAGNATATSDTTNARVDNIAPTVSSIAVPGASSSDTSVNFVVSFSEPVVNVSTDDFVLVGTGSAAGSIASVSGSGLLYAVTVASISGTGSLKVNLNGSTNVVDAVGNTVPAYTSGSTHTVAVLNPPNAPTIGAVTAGDGLAWVAFTAPASNGGSAITGYTVTSNPGGITAGGNGYTTSPIMVTGLVNGTPYTFTVTATNAIGTSVASTASGRATPMGDQTIVFAQPAGQYFGDSPTLSAMATSGLTVSFSSSTTGVCTTTSDGVLTFVTSGSCTINADQAGDGAWNAASTVSRTFTVNAIVPGAPTVGTATAGDTQANVSFTAPASNGGATITGYTVTANPGGATGTGAGSPITVASLTNGIAYTFTVTATNSAGTGAASAATNSVTPAGAQTITFANPGAQSFGTSPNLSILGGGVTSTSGLPVSFTSSTTAVCTITSGGVLTFVTAGTCTINADQAGNSSYLAATQVSRSFTVIPVVPGAPTTVVATAGDTQANVAFVAPSFIGGAPITGYTVTVSPADVAPVNGASSPIVVTGLTNGQAYTFTVTADNVAGTGPASGASNSVTPKATQTITFINPGAQNFGTSPTLSATSDSGLPPTFTSSTTGVCTITSGGALTFVTTGTCTINADQAGNGSYLAATQVTRSFAVVGVTPGAPTSVAATAGDAQATVTFSAPVFTGGAAITGYTVTSSPGNFTGTGAGAPIVVTGLSNGTAYTFTVTATNGAGTGGASVASAAVTPQGAQVITFNNPGNQSFGSTPTLTATTDSGLPVVFSTSTPTVCTVNAGGTLAFPAVGSCTVHANAAGDAGHLPAAQVTQTFNVVGIVASAPTGVSAVATGNDRAAVSFAAPTMTGGSAITQYTVTSSPGGVTASGSGSPITITGLPAGVTYTFTVTATNATGSSAASAASNAVTVIPALVSSDVTLNLSYAAPATVVALDVTGTPTSVNVVAAPLHGSVSVSGTTITYQPNAGYAGTDRFTYTATDAFSTSAPAAVNVNIAAATVTLAAATLPNATGGSSYRQAVVASGGAAPYSYAVTQGALPAGVTLSPLGELSGTPTVAGSFSFQVTATDSSTGTGPFSGAQGYTLVVDAPAIALTPATLPAAANAVAYSQALSASGGTAPYRYAVVSGTLPTGMDLSSAGTLSGTPSLAGAQTFTVEARDTHGFVGTQAYTLAVSQATQAIADFVANPTAPTFAPNGTFALSARGGASPNPVTFASTTPSVCSVSGATVTMLSAGVCTLTADQTGDANYLPASQVRLDVAIAAARPQLAWMGDVQKVYGEPDFELPDPRSDSRGAFTFSSRNPQVATVNGRTVTLVGHGTAVLVATQAAHGSYTAGEVEIELLVADRPDPTLDAEVTGGIQAQVDASVRFASAQQSNIQGRLRQVRNGTNASSNTLTLSYAGDGRAQGLSLPVGQLGGNAWAGLPATSGWGVWAAGTMTLGKSDGGPSGFDFNTDGITVGADRAFGENVLLGIAGSIGRNDSDFDRSPSRVDADQKSLALYGLWRAGDHLFVDGLLATGQLDFDIGRWSEVTGSVASAQRDGDQVFGALTFGYEHQQPGMTLTGYGRVDGSRTTLDAYRESGLGVYDLSYGRQRVRNSALAVGMEGSHPLAGDAARYRPFWNIEYRQALDNNSSVDINYVTRPADRDYVLGVRSYNDDAFAVGAGLDVEFGSGWLFSLLLGHEQGRNAMTSNSIGLRLSYGSGGAPVAPTGDAAQLQSSEPECGRPRCRAR